MVDDRRQLPIINYARVRAGWTGPDRSRDLASTGGVMAVNVSYHVPTGSATPGADRVRSAVLPYRVSVVIPTRNRSGLLAEAVRSVQAVDGLDLDLEIL